MNTKNLLKNSKAYYEDNDYYPHQSFSTNLIPIEDEDSSIDLDPLSIDSYLRLDDSSSKKTKKQKKKERLEVFDSFDDEDEEQEE